jgi:DnaJ homolog subfamily B member 4
LNNNDKMPPQQSDYYKLLEVEPSANENDIKKSYYKLAKKWHPVRQYL